jgi:hypothetical protein
MALLQRAAQSAITAAPAPGTASALDHRPCTPKRGAGDELCVEKTGAYPWWLVIHNLSKKV